LKKSEHLTLQGSKAKEQERVKSEPAQAKEAFVDKKQAETDAWWINVLEEVVRHGIAAGDRDEPYMIKVQEALSRLKNAD
jgi:hypothetical protein